MRYTVVETDFGDEETKNFGKRDEFVSLTSLYEIKTLATISGDFENTENEDPVSECAPPPVFAESNEKWLAIAVEDDVSIFTISFDLQHLFTQPFRAGSCICGIGWLGDSHILAVVTSSMDVLFLSAESQTVITALNFPSTTPCKRGFVSSDVLDDICCLSVARQDGEIITLRIPEWSVLTGPSKESVLASCKESLQGAQITRAVSKWSINYLVCTGNLLIQEEVFADFMFVNKPKVNPRVGTIALIVKTENRMEMQVRSLASLEVVYCVAVNEKTALLPVSETADRVILLVESFSSNAVNDGDMVKVREIVEAQPEMKLQRLISRNQLDQAEQFATQFRLDIQKVHVARMNYLFTQATMDDSDDGFSRLMKSFENVKDHNLVGEICFSGAVTFENYDRITNLLTYAKKRAITDSDTIDRLSQASYVLATYRLMNGPEDANFDSNSLWQNFVAGILGEGEWHELFIQTLGNGLIKEARILWNRHIASITPFFCNVDCEDVTEANLEKFFNVLRLALLRDIDCWRDIIAFLEFDFIPTCLSKMPKQVCALLVDFLLGLARNLETQDVERFPLNALHATSTFERILQKQVVETITGTRQAELAYVGCLLRSDAHGKRSRLTELDEYSANLRMIERLKTVYNCPLSYNTYVGLNSEQICHQILQESVQNPNLMKKNVERYARQFMAEHNLEPDETLYRYIEAVSSRSRGMVGITSAWHDQCLMISETIANLSIRSKAVCMVAKGSNLPWNKRLSEAVQSVLNNPQVDQDIKRSLERVCHSAELGKMLMSYSFSTGMLDSILATEHNLIKFIRLMFKYDRYSIAQRLVDAVKVVSIYCKLNEKHSPLVSLVRIYAMYAEHLQRTNSSDLTVLQFLDEVRADKGDQFLSDVASCLVDAMIKEIDSAVSIWTEVSVAQRKQLVVSASSVILRFMNQDPHYMRLYQQLRSIETLQESYNLYATTPQLDMQEWREATLKNFIEREERSLLEVFAFSRILGMSRDEASRLTIKLGIDSGNTMGTLTIIRDALRNVPNASAGLAEACVHGCEFVLWNLQEAVGKIEAPADTEVVEQSVESVIILSRVLRILEPVTSHSLCLQEAVARMHGYVGLFLQVVKQCMLDDTTSDSSTEKEQSTVKDDAFNDDRRIYGVRRRVGVYQMRSEGPLFARMEAIAHIASVAQSAVGTEKLDDETKRTLHTDQATRWNDLFNFLSLSNQDLLEFQARVYAASLPWWKEQERRSDVGLRISVRNICLRALQAHPCDLWTPCTLLSSLPPSTIEEVVLELRNVVSNRKSPQTMINFLRVVQFAMILTGNYAPAKMLTDTFIKTLWAKRLGKACLSPALPRKPIELAIEEFAKHKVDPNVVTEYVDEFCGVNELPDKLLSYAITLVQLASAAEDKLEITRFLEIAHQALKVNEVKILAEKSFSAFRDILYTVCPYNYPTIQFIVSHLSSTCTEENQSFVTGCVSILNFIMERRRENAICKDELVWYTNREKQMATDKKDSNIEDFGAYCRCFFEQGTQSSSFNARTSSFSEDGNESNLYERDVLVVEMPQMAKQRLPFHPFLYLAAGDVERFLVPIVEKELDIYNVLCWQTVLRSVAWLRACPHFSRSRLLSVAVGKISAEVIAKGQNLSPEEVTVIEQLLTQTTSRNAVVNCVAMCFKKLPLCETKIRLMEIGRNIAQQWLMATDLDPPMDAAERLAIEEQVNRLGLAIEKYNTELILKKSGLYNEKTCDLTESPEELVGYIYSNCIDWKCEKEREHKMAVITQLAKANHMNNLESIQEELITNWLIADKADDAYAVDPNDTMGNPGVDVGMSAVDENEIFLLPFFDVAVDRIVHVLKLINMEKIMLDLITYLRKEPSTVAGGFRTIVRAACVLLRAYTDDQLKKANYDQLKICVDLDAVLYGRLLELAHVDIPLDTFRRQEKSVVVRGLVAPGVRWTPQLTFLVASLIVDNDIADRSVVEVVLNRLQAAQKREMFVTLLSFCRQEKKLHRVRNLAMLWARAADWSLGSIEHINEERRDEFERWFYFAISCPVEGGRAFDSIRNALRSRNYILAAHLISVVASFAQKSTQLDLSMVNPDRELVFRWATDAMHMSTAAV
ncbi:hypothetical protein GCK32_003275 [Trichostrongylus colubriformis]|uniref:RZZ complex subunit KNTC1/ROD C-terminal domain-containing protein n=1 Tax=Trichostrongylus colubriformis TaxID=6319 RepID=A0AAN8F2V8_TRICO